MVRSLGMGSGGKFRAERNEAFLGDRKRVLIQITTCDEQKINPGR